ncbi:alpha/beta hydrolase [Arthrobacter sp. TMP15]|uniref:alpha/beta fold hydrolase n=1 Tax=Arthrobacter sp. TMP15 TaxID=3140789 RepID=UPI0031BAB95C
MAVTQNPHDGVELSYDEVGQGEPLLLVHGSALSRAIWRGFGYTKEFQKQFRVITMDLRGHGRSGKPDSAGDYTMDTLVADVLAVLDAVQAPQAHFGGYSVGGRMGLSLAVQAPERLLSLTTLGGTYRIQPGNIGDLFFPGYDDALGSGGMPAFVQGWEEHLGRALDAATRAAFLANDAAAMRAYFAHTERDLPIPESRLAGIATPTLLMAGSADTGRLKDSKRACELMANARFVELPRRNHGTTLGPAGPVLEQWLPFLDSL